MTVLESLPAAAFVFALVFAVLAALCILIKLFSYIINALVKKDNSQAAITGADADLVPAAAAEALFSSGQLKLHNVDERTAAMIMAIVSDESGIPLSELIFKSIKAI